MGMMSFFLGIDAGGTKTTAQISNQEGEILGQGESGGANPHNQQLENVLSNIGLAVLIAQKQAKENHHQAFDTFTGACIGMAGLDTDDDRELIISGLRAGMFKNLCRRHGLLLVNDGLIGLRSGTNQNYGICLISGTGANAYGINREGRQFQAGDWGYVLGDGGSGFAIGHKLLRHVMKEYDGRADPSVLSVKILHHRNFRSISELVNWVYGEEIPVRDIAALTRLFADPEIADLTISQQAVEEAVIHQISAFQAVLEKCGLGAEPFPTVLIGGLMNLPNPDFPGKLEAAIHRITPRAQVICRKESPIAGALALAREMADKSSDPLIHRFMIKF